MADAKKKDTTYVVFEEAFEENTAHGRKGLFPLGRVEAKSAPQAVKMIGDDLDAGHYTLVAIPEGNITRLPISRAQRMETLMGEGAVQEPEVREMEKSGEAVT